MMAVKYPQPINVRAYVKSASEVDVLWQRPLELRPTLASYLITVYSSMNILSETIVSAGKDTYLEALTIIDVKDEYSIDVSAVYSPGPYGMNLTFSEPCSLDRIKPISPGMYEQ